MRRWMMLRTEGAPGTPPPDTDPEPDNPGPAQLNIDFGATAATTNYGDAAGNRAVWNSLASGYVADDAGLENTRIVTKDGRRVLEVRHLSAGQTPIGLRLGQGATRLNLGREGWCSYEVMFNADWPFTKGKFGKLPGLSGGETFPTGVSTLSAQMSGWSARLGHDPDDALGVNVESDAHIYYYDRSNNPTTGTHRLTGEEWPSKADGQPSSASGTKFFLQRDRWYQVSERVKMNSSATAKDGELEVYIDGVLRLRRTGIRWVGPDHSAAVRAAAFDPAKGVDGFFFSHFFGADTSGTTTQPDPGDTTGNLPGNMLRASYVPADAPLLAKAYFNDGTTGDMRQEETAGPNGITVVNNEALLTLSPGDDNGYGGIPGHRCELKVYSRDTPEVDFVKYRHFVTWDTFYPTGFQTKAGTQAGQGWNNHMLLMQVHGPNTDGSYVGGIVAMRSRDGKLELVNQTYAASPTSTTSPIIWSETFRENVWTRWGLECLLLQSGGVIRLWKNGVLVHTTTGRVYTTGRRQWLGFKCGIYARPTTTVTARIDNVQIFGEGTGSTPTPPTSATPTTTCYSWFKGIRLGSSAAAVGMVVPGVEPDPENPQNPDPPPASTAPDILDGDIDKISGNPGFGGAVTNSVLQQAFGTLESGYTRGNDFAVVTDSNGEKYIRQRFIPNSSGSSRAGWRKQLPAGNEKWFSYQVMFESGWEWVKGGKLPGMGGGTYPSGGNPPADGQGFSGRYMWLDNGGKRARKDPRIEGYWYYSRQSDTYGEEVALGSANVADGGSFFPPLNQWITITQRVKLVTGSGNVSEIQTWINGVDQGTWKGALRVSGSYTVDKIAANAFYGGDNSTWAPSKTTYARWRRFKIATTAAGVDGVT